MDKVVHDFAWALVKVLQGEKIFRENWNGKGMFVVYQKGYPEGIASNKNTSEALGIPEGTVIKYRPYLMMYTAQGDCVPWVASQTDILGSDWEVVR